MAVLELLIGKPPVIAAICNLNVKSAFPWRRESKWRAKGDMPSASVMRALLAHAAAHQIPLTAEHLIWGAPASEIEALAAAHRIAPAYDASRNAVAFVSQRSDAA